MKPPRLDDARPGPDAEIPRSPRGERKGRSASTWRSGAFLATWVAALALWIQFTFASLEELEAQAASLGGVVVAILLVGGAALWLAKPSANGDL